MIIKIYYWEGKKMI